MARFPRSGGVLAGIRQARAIVDELAAVLATLEADLDADAAPDGRRAPPPRRAEVPPRPALAAGVGLADLLDALRDRLVASDAEDLRRMTDADRPDSPSAVAPPLLPSQSDSARQLLGWSAADLARAADVSLATILNLEQGKRPVSDKVLLTIRRTLEAQGLCLAGGGVAPAHSRRNDKPDRIASEGADAASLAAALRRLLEARQTPLSVAQMTSALVQMGLLPAGPNAQKRTMNTLKWWGHRCGIEELPAGTYRLAAAARTARLSPEEEDRLTPPVVPIRSKTPRSRGKASHGRSARLR